MCPPRLPPAAIMRAWLGLAGCLLLAIVPSTLAQDPPGSVGLGLHVGAPTGITAKVHQRPTLAYTLLVAWDLDEELVLNVHGQVERPFDRSPLRLIAGPGLLTGLEGRTVVLGISGLLGTNFYQKRFEVFLQAMPRLQLIPDLRAEWGFGIGLRYYFDQRATSNPEH